MGRADVQSKGKARYTNPQTRSSDLYYQLVGARSDICTEYTESTNPTISPATTTSTTLPSTKSLVPTDKCFRYKHTHTHRLFHLLLSNLCVIQIDQDISRSST